MISNESTSEKKLYYEPGKMSDKFAMLVAAVTSWLTVYSTLKVLSSFRETELKARSAASSAEPLLMSIPKPKPNRPVPAAGGSVGAPR